jgi:alpha-L-fucosidase
VGGRQDMKIEKFLEDRFGMFIHWGAYATNGRSEWQKSYDRLSNEGYQKYIDAFNPKKDCIREWARLAKKSGIKYVVMTTKHHDGFCLFKSEYTDYSTYNTINRDLVAEYVEAFRAEAIQIGFYYSLIDWYHPDYPTYGDLQHPLRDDLKEKEKEPSRNLSTYIQYLHNQVRELLTNYGNIDILWFDYDYNNPEGSGLPNMKGETWEATKLVKMIRELQPNIIINNRLGGDLRKENPEYYAGDFTSPEQLIPPQGMLNEKGEVIPWEACVTMNGTWGYSQHVHTYKNTKTLIRALIECVSKNGNLLLNIGPTAQGDLPKEAIQRLLEIGQWMEKNSESIYSCKASQLPKPDWGRYTEKDGKLYAHIFERGIGPIPLIGLEGKIKSAKLLSDGVLIPIERPWNATKFPHDAFLTLPWSNDLPDDASTVVELMLNEEVVI